MTEDGRRSDDRVAGKGKRPGRGGALSGVRGARQTTVRPTPAAASASRLGREGALRWGDE
jgi:hypothetical protein